MEQRILLSNDPVGSARERLHAVFPVHSAYEAGRNEVLNAVTSSNAAQAKPRRSETAYAIPGAIGQLVYATFTLTVRRAAYQNEIGLFLVDDATGRIGTLRPGDRGYAAAALGRRQILFNRGQRAGAVTHLQLPAGGFFGTYLVQNSSSRRFLACNPRDGLTGHPHVFFSFAAANPDHFNHLHLRPGDIQRWEDMTHGGDRDFNDAVLKMSMTLVRPPIPTVTFGLDPSTDSAPVGDDRTTFATVILVGQTGPNLSVSLLETAATTTSDSSGQFVFGGVSLAQGANTFDVRVTDAAGHTATAQAIITRIPVGMPLVTAALAHDTAPDGQTNADGITSDPSVAGTVTDTSPIASFRAGLDSTAPGNFLDVTADLGPGGTFRFDPARMNQINGGLLADGPTFSISRRPTIRGRPPATISPLPWTLKRPR
jgi:hypothetical protein